jgi:chloride channel protein, CIC family
VIERGILGAHPVILVDQTYALDHPTSLVCYAFLGVAAAIVSIAFTDGLLKVRVWFRRLSAVPAWAHPALGGLATGVLAVVLLRFLGTTGITGGGYDTLGRALAGQLGLQVLLALCVAKLVATVCSYSSGGAGGIFAPALFVGAMLGGAVGNLDVLLFDHESRQLGAFALVGMGAVFAGTIRAPMTSVLIIFEMTGGYGLVLPLMLANMTSYIIARRLRPTPIYEALLQQDGVVLPFTAAPEHALESLVVSDAMTANVLTTHLGQPIADVVAHVAEQSFACVPVVDDAELVLGTIPVAALRAASSSASVETLLRPPHVVRSDAPLLRAVVRMNDLGVRQLLVVDAESGRKLVGVLAMSDVVRAHARAAREGEARATGSPHSETLSELRASSVMLKASPVPGDSKVTALRAQLQEVDAMAFIVRLGSDSFSILLPEQLNEFAADDELGKMLLASDLARPAPSIAASADFAVIVKAMADDETEAAVVLDPETKDPIGIVTKMALARALLETYAKRAS